MAFINEKISAEDKRQYDFGWIKDLTVFQPLEPRYWTIDRERNVFLMWTQGGNADDPNFEKFVLYIDGYIIEVAMNQEVVGKFNAQVTIKWLLIGMWIPSEIKVPRDVVLEILKDALSVYGVRGILLQAASTISDFEF